MDLFSLLCFKCRTAVSTFLIPHWDEYWVVPFFLIFPMLFQAGHWATLFFIVTFCLITPYFCCFWWFFWFHSGVLISIERILFDRCNIFVSKFRPIFKIITWKLCFDKAQSSWLKVLFPFCLIYHRGLALLGGILLVFICYSSLRVIFIDVFFWDFTTLPHIRSFSIAICIWLWLFCCLLSVWKIVLSSFFLQEMLEYHLFWRE